MQTRKGFSYALRNDLGHKVTPYGNGCLATSFVLLFKNGKIVKNVISLKVNVILGNKTILRKVSKYSSTK